MKLLHDLWTKPFGEYEDKNVRLLAIITSVVLHIAALVVVALLARYDIPPLAPHSSPELGGMSGGGGGESTMREIEFGPSPGNDDADEPDHTSRLRIIRLKIRRPAAEGTPVIAQEKKNKPTTRKKSAGLSLVQNIPKRRIRGSGPGAGGGTGGGVGGGIGKGRGYSIDWGGTGTRRLLSGKLPQYPKGANKEMPVTLKFTVLPDGSITQVTPLKRGDELLEREAINALETWRFDPLPEQLEQRLQYGTVTFNFKLEKTVSLIQ